MKIERALTFRAALDQKLNAIIRAFGTATEGAKQCKVSLRAFNHWRAGYFPTSALLRNIDEAYAMAVELLNDPELIKRREKTEHEIRCIARKLKLTEGAARKLRAEGLY